VLLKKYESKKEGRVSKRALKRIRKGE